MCREHCPECGHLLSKNGSECHFCGGMKNLINTAILSR